MDRYTKRKVENRVFQMFLACDRADRLAAAGKQAEAERILSEVREKAGGFGTWANPATRQAVCQKAMCL